MAKYDSRFKRLSQNPRFVLINNYKCGFSSSNLLLAAPVNEILYSDKLIFFYRNIFFRVISVFINWCITDKRYKEGRGWLLRYIQSHLGPIQYRHFIDLLHHNQIVDAFVIYVKLLGDIYQFDNHTLPQIAILDHYDVEKIDHFVELENAGFLFELTGVEFPFEKSNASDNHAKQALLASLKRNQVLKESMRDIYHADISYFRNRNIDVEGLQ